MGFITWSNDQIGGFSEKVWSSPTSIQNHCMTEKKSEVVPNNVLQGQKVVFSHFGLGFDS